MLQDLLSELADAGVLGVEIQRYQGCDEPYRLYEGRGRRRWATVQIDIARISIFLLLPCTTFILNQEFATAQHSSGRKKKSLKSVPTN